MALKLDQDAFIGHESVLPLVSYAGNGTASLSVKVIHTITGPKTIYVIYRNNKLWHEADFLSSATIAWNKLVELEQLS